MEPSFDTGMRESSIPIKRALELFRYDPETGIITRMISYGRAVAGQEFTGPHDVSVEGISIRFNRLAWALHNRMWPPQGYWVDHKDGIKANNKITNLRLATPTQNQQNKSGSGQYSKGVTWRDRKRKPWQAKIRVNGIRLHLGSFETEHEAAQAYQEACIKYHGEFACPT